MPSGHDTHSSRSPIRALFIFLMVAIVTGYAIFAGRMWDEINDAARAEMALVARLLIQATNEVFNHDQSMLQILGQRMAELDAVTYPERGRPLIDQMRRINASIAGFGLARTDGQLVLISGVPPGVPLPNLIEQPESAKSFRAVMETGQMQTGRTYHMDVLQRWVIPIRVAIKDGDGVIVQVMAAGIDIDAESATWNALELPEYLEVRVMRPDGHWQFVKPLEDHLKHHVYDNEVEPGLFEAISARRGTSADAQFVYNDRLYRAAYFDKWNLYGVVSLPRSHLIVELATKLAIPSLLFVVFLVVGAVIYSLANREQKRYEAKLVRQATYDSLTKLPNRLLAMDRLQQAILRAQRSQQSLAVIFVDLDHFKRINDGFGHLVGDELLTQCAERLRTTTRVADTVARLGGDEFLVILQSLLRTDDAEIVLKKIHAALDSPFKIGQREIFAHCSMGVALYPTDGSDPADLLKAADTALYKAKDSGRKTHCYFSQELNEGAERRVELEAALRHALANDELYPLFQPQFDLVTGWCTGAEILLRWQSKTLGAVSPAEFIPVAEESGLIGPMGEFVLVQACELLGAVTDLAPKGFRIAVNVSARQLRDRAYIGNLGDILRKHGRDPQEFDIEITESTLVEDPDQLVALHEHGFRLAVDDFGTGFSSLSYLGKFPISILKIDQSFVRDIETDKQDALLTLAIINIGRTFELDIVAEGIETEGQLAFLRQAGCRFGQGFHLGLPMSRDELLTMFGRERAMRAINP